MWQRGVVADGREVDMWDPMVEVIYTLSDVRADGIAKQFPAKFQ